jgi:hypothetical protein
MRKNEMSHSGALCGSSTSRERGPYARPTIKRYGAVATTTFGGGSDFADCGGQAGDQCLDPGGGGPG